jgi:hypothetical protein
MYPGFLWFFNILKLDPNTVQVQTDKTSEYKIYLVSPPFIPVLVFSSGVNYLYLSYEHEISNRELETIYYPVHMSYSKSHENVTFSS